MAVNRRRLFLPEMEGAMARWYDRQRGTASQIATYRTQAVELTAGLQNGARVLEVAPGPGYLAVEIARLARFSVTGLDVSRTMVEIATGHARDAAVAVDFRQGDVAAMPFRSQSFDLIVCQAAFKNFRQPVGALNEMHRVLRPGGMAVIQDMRKDASASDIDAEVRQQGQGAMNRLIVGFVLKGLRRRAYTSRQFEQLVAQSAFRTADIQALGIGIEVRLLKEPSVGNHKEKTA